MLAAMSFGNCGYAFPTIVGVNFVEAGDARRVVDELNGVRPSSVPAP